MKPRVGLVGAGRVKDSAAAGRATSAAATQKAGAPGGKGKAAAVIAGGRAPVATEGAKLEGEVKAEDKREVLVEGGQGISVEVSSEDPQHVPEEHHEEHLEVLVSDIGSHDEGGSVPTSPRIEGEEIDYAEGSVREGEASPPPPVSGSEHEHEHPDEEEHGSPQLSQEQQEELLKDVPALPEPSKKEVAEAAAHPGAEEHLEKVVPPYQPSILPTDEQVDEEERENVEGIPNDA